jgi:hypothetical protein
MRANQLRLWFASMAYVPLCALRRIALKTSDVGFCSGTMGKLCTRWCWINVTIRNSAVYHALMMKLTVLEKTQGRSEA